MLINGLATSFKKISNRAKKWKQMPKSVWYTLLGELINGFGTFVGPFLVLFLTTERNFSAFAAGIMAACIGIGSCLNSTMLSGLSDQFGRKRTMTWALALAGVTSILLAFGPVQLIAVLALLQGVLNGFYLATLRA